MKENVGRIDQIVRIVVGPALGGLGAFLLRRGNLVGGAVAIASSAAVIQTTITRVCPVNALFGIDTRSQDERLRDSRNSLRLETERAAKRFVAPDVENDPLRLA